MTRRDTVAFATCRELPDLDPDDLLAAQALVDRGIRVVPAVWDDPAVDWSAYDLVVIRSTWDYAARRPEFLEWARHVPRLANPVRVVAWNTDKTYLADLAHTGLPVVPTTWIPPGAPERVAALLDRTGAHVVKPSVGAGSVGALRCDLSDPDQAARAVAHAHGLLDRGLTVMVQPYLGAVDVDGETALLYVDGAFSHAIRKGPLLTGPDQQVDGLYEPEQIDPRDPTEQERALADRVLDAVPGRPRLLYARVDLLPGPVGEPMLLELELAEPSLFLASAEGAADRFAAAVAAWAVRRP